MSESTEMTPAGRVILTHGRSLMALAAARSLGEHGVEVIGCDDSPMMALSFSRYVTRTFLHAAKIDGEEAFIASLVAAVQAHAPEDDRPYVLMPIHEDTPMIARHRHRFEPYIKVTTPSIEAIGQVFPKDRLVPTAERLDVPIPPTRLVDSAADLREAAAAIGLPLFVKPATATGGRGITKVDTPEGLDEAWELAAASAKEGAILAQGMAPGEDYCLTALCQDGHVRAQMAYRNLETFPGEGGFGVLRETVEPGPMPAIAERLLEPLGWTGVIEMDFRWDGDPDSTPKLLEINPRFWGGLFQSLESGVQYPWLLYCLFVHGAVPESPSPRIGQRTKVPLLWLLGAIEDLAEDTGRFEQLEAAWSEAGQHLRGGSWWQGLGQLTQALWESILPSRSRQRFDEKWQRAAEARAELFTAEDPYAGLGLLYTIGYLIRNGRLPEEMRR